MGQPLSDEALDVIFREAHTHVAWLPGRWTTTSCGRSTTWPRWDRLPPTRMPMRIVFVKTPEGERTTQAGTDGRQRRENHGRPRLCHRRQ